MSLHQNDDGTFEFTDGNTSKVWENNNVQFPRLLAEILAIGLTPRQFADLSKSMDLNSEDIKALLYRAEKRWETIKSNGGADERLTDALHSWTQTPCCVDGWVMGHGIERCDDCKRFEDDEEAAKHIFNVIETLETNGYLDAASVEYARLAIHDELNEEEDDDE